MSNFQNLIDGEQDLSFKEGLEDNAAVASISPPLRAKLARAGIKAFSDCLQRGREKGESQN